MKRIIIASMDRNGVIGRTSKACDGACGGRGTWCVPFECGPDRTCSRCNGTGRVPANDIPWSYPEYNAHVNRMTNGAWPPFVARDHYFTAEQHIAFARREGHSAVVFVDPYFYAAALPLADELDLTLIDAAFEGDVKFPLGRAHPRLLFGAVEFAVPGIGSFERVEGRQGTTPELTFTRWIRR